MEKKEHSSPVSEQVNQCSHYGEEYGSSLKKKKTTNKVTIVISLWGIYPEKTIIRKDACNPIFMKLCLQ